MGKELTLVILAAGMGSRFGGLKQIEPVGPNNEFIIDYSIYDAKKAGFNKIVFLIKHENYDVFKETIGKRVEGKIDVSYAFQDILDLPKNMEFEERKKPLGTAHAIWCCRNFIKGNFAIINADDFYGYDSFKVLVDYLKNNDNFDEFKKKLNLILCLNQVIQEEPELTGEVAKRIAEKLKERHRKLAQMRGGDANEDKVAIFSRYMSILAVAERKNLNDLANYTIFQLNDEYKRWQLKDYADKYFQAKVAGASGMDEPDDWTQDIYSSEFKKNNQS